MSSTNDALNDEITSINSIFDDGTLAPVSDDASICSLQLPSLPSVTLRVEFPANYPDAPPSILGTQHVGDDVPKGVGTRVVGIVRDVLAQVYRPGEACIFDLLEESKEAIDIAEDNGTLQLHDEQQGLASAEENASANSYQPDTQTDLGPEPPWTIAPPITEKKSIFLSRSAPVSSPAEAKQYLAHLLHIDKKVARATHNITAWRIRGANGATYQDCDDDGETAAGGRVLHLMQLMDVWNVMVVVTRWYGGVLLGPDRFRLINAGAREALVLGGFVKEGEDKSGKKKGKK